MDYTELAATFVNQMGTLRKARPQKHIDDALHGESFVLHFIAQRRGVVLPGEIGQEMDVSTARIASALNSLEKKGLITRKIDAQDRRRILVSITKEGETLACAQHRALIGKTAEMLALLGEQDAQEYVRITCKLAEIFLSQKNCK